MVLGLPGSFGRRLPPIGFRSQGNVLLVKIPVGVSSFQVLPQTQVFQDAPIGSASPVPQPPALRKLVGGSAFAPVRQTSPAAVIFGLFQWPGLSLALGIQGSTHFFPIPQNTAIGHLGNNATLSQNLMQETCYPINYKIKN
jgi:hypothetical protein